jgi:hypothetical protein
MKLTSKYFLIGLVFLFIECSEINTGQSNLDPAIISSLKQLGSEDGFKPYIENPIIDVGSEGSFDGGALGSMSVLLVDSVFHVYYETWGIRSSAEWDAGEYESLQIGHATSTDGINWIKDPNNPVLPHGGEADFDPVSGILM